MLIDLDCISELTSECSKETELSADHLKAGLTADPLEAKQIKQELPDEFSFQGTPDRTSLDDNFTNDYPIEQASNKSDPLDVYFNDSQIEQIDCQPDDHHSEVDSPLPELAPALYSPDSSFYSSIFCVEPKQSTSKAADSTEDSVQLSANSKVNNSKTKDNKTNGSKKRTSQKKAANANNKEKQASLKKTSKSIEVISIKKMDSVKDSLMINLGRKIDSSDKRKVVTLNEAMNMDLKKVKIERANGMKIYYFKCPMCEYQTNTSQSMNDHLYCIHCEMKDNYICNICQQKFGWKNNAQRHMRKKHKIADPIAKRKAIITLVKLV